MFDKTVKYLIKSLIILAALYILTTGVSIAAPVPDTMLEGYFGGTNDQPANGIWQTSDNGFIIVGAGPDDSSTSTNLYLVKLDWQGNQQWSRKVGGTYGLSVRETSDYGFIATGRVSDDLYLVKTDVGGNKQWEKVFSGGQQLIGNSVQQTWDRGYIVAGQVATSVSDWDAYILRIDENGNKQWDKTIGTARGDDLFYSVWQNVDGSYILGGLSGTEFNPKPYLALVDIDGNVQWSKTYEGEGEWDNFNGGWCGVQQTRDGGYIYAGVHNSYAYLLKTDANGNKQWSKDYGTIMTGFNAVQQTWDDGYILAGYYRVADEHIEKVQVIRTDANGNEQWQQTYDGQNYAEGRSALQIGNGSYVIAGWTKAEENGIKNMYFIQLDKDMTPVPNAQYIADTIPSTMEANSVYTVTVTFTNTGTMPWTFQDRTSLGYPEGANGDAAKFGAIENQTIPIGIVIRPGQSARSTFTMKAPAMNGTYYPKFQMAWEDHYMFGDVLNKSVRVVNGTPNPDEQAGTPTAAPTGGPTAQPTQAVTGTPTAAPIATPATGTPTAAPAGNGGGCLPGLVLPLLIVGLVAFGASIRGKSK
ncbi:MAG: hypothetical protein A4E28_03079 [Methanocella sp. PtaU1.Bin125]|nr:MAG: hypothetical protein A4E28_03079 [Methanocella sp. PtaU1.Bin125]